MSAYKASEEDDDKETCLQLFEQLVSRDLLTGAFVEKVYQMAVTDLSYDPNHIGDDSDSGDQSMEDDDDHDFYDEDDEYHFSHVTMLFSGVKCSIVLTKSMIRAGE